MATYNMRFLICLFLSVVGGLTLFSVKSLAEQDVAPTAGVPAGGGTPLSEQELQARIGRYGEAQQIPEDFQFNEAEIILWRKDHLANVTEPMGLYYEFVKSGSLEDGFSDSVYLKILKMNEDGSKDVLLDFFTAERKQLVSADNVTGITGNPILGIYMQGDIHEMYRLTEGHWRHFQKQIKISLRKDAMVEPVTFSFNGKQVHGKKLYFSPYMNDPHRRDFEKYAEKYYEFIFSDQIPGSLYQIKTVIPDKSKVQAEPLILETLKLVDVKPLQS